MLIQYVVDMEETNKIYNVTVEARDGVELTDQEIIASLYKVIEFLEEGNPGTTFVKNPDEDVPEFFEQEWDPLDDDLDDTLSDLET